MRTDEPHHRIESTSTLVEGVDFLTWTPRILLAVIDRGAQRKERLFSYLSGMWESAGGVREPPRKWESGRWARRRASRILVCLFGTKSDGNSEFGKHKHKTKQVNNN